MKFIVKLQSEITIKSRPVRKRFTKMLETNIKNVLLRIDEQVTTSKSWDNIEVNSANNTPENRDKLVEALKCIPGIPTFLEVQQTDFTDVHSIYEKTTAIHAKSIENKTFCVRVKRTGTHAFKSIDVERYVGGGLNKDVPTSKVKLNKPDITIYLEIKKERLFIVTERHKAMGGFPIATQEDVLSLMSGGFDSAVSSYQMIKKGSRTHYCFFNLGGSAHEIGVKQVSYYLWNKFGASHKVKFFTIDFEEVVGEILEKVDNGQMGVVLKRMMVRAAEKLAKRAKIQALITGESLGQVSSQTLTNLNVIDRVTETLILRPLVAYDKQDIIDIARKIGTEDLSKTIPEYCGVISKKPTVKAVLSKIEEEESHFNFELLDNAIKNTRVYDMRDIATETEAEINTVEMVEQITQDSIVIDIRSPDEEENNPLTIENVEVIHIPFFKLNAKFETLAQDRHYFLYCEQGVMSKLQALYLQDNGYSNVKVYTP